MKSNSPKLKQQAMASQEVVLALAREVDLEVDSYGEIHLLVE